MFLPFIGYTAGDWLIDHWSVARELDRLLRPYAFDASVMLGLAVGLVQLGWEYARRREVSAYVLQQLGLLVVFTVPPLALGHYVGGWNVFGFVWIVIALAYAVDARFQAPLFLAYPRRFAPHLGDRLQEPAVRAVVVQMEWAFVATALLNAAFLLEGTHLLPKALYLLVLPFFAKALWGSFTAFCLAYPAWIRRRRSSLSPT